VGTILGGQELFPLLLVLRVYTEVHRFVRCGGGGGCGGGGRGVFFGGRCVSVLGGGRRGLSGLGGGGRGIAGLGGGRRGIASLCGGEFNFHTSL